jgi:hypothetical protein
MTLRQLLAAIISPLFKRLARAIPVADPWEELSVSLPLKYYADGLQDDFPVYLRGPSNIAAQSLDEICDWLDQCTYQTDREQFGREHWQHLLEFEDRRVGDCDDYAIWAWRKLIDLGYDARLVVGKSLPIANPLIGHVWVVYRAEDRLYLLDGTAARDSMVRSLDDARTEYRPEYGADARGRRYAYSGALLTLKERDGIPKHRSDALTG